MLNAGDDPIWAARWWSAPTVKLGVDVTRLQHRMIVMIQQWNKNHWDGSPSLPRGRVLLSYLHLRYKGIPERVN